MMMFLTSVKKMTLLRSWTMLLMTMTLTDEIKQGSGIDWCSMMPMSQTALKIKGRSEWVIWYTWKNQDDKVCEGIDSSSRRDTLNDRSAHTPGWLGRRGLFRGWEGRCLWWVQGSKAVNEAAWGGFSFWWGSSSPSQQQLECYPSWLLLPRCKHLPMPGPQGSEWLSRSCIAFRTIQGHLSLLSMLTSPKPLE